jgi:hypothetical protein
VAESGASRFESLVDQQIRLAQERGEFDNLPGMGKPLPGAGQPDDDLWWVRGYLKREGLSAEPLLPTSLRLAREIERLPDTVADLPSEQMVRERVLDLNRRIAEYLRAPSGPHVRLRLVDPDDMAERWRAARLRKPGTSRDAVASGGGDAAAEAAGDAAADAGGAAGERSPRPPRWRRRWFARRRAG